MQIVVDRRFDCDYFTYMTNVLTDPRVKAAYLAAKFAQQIGLPAGNMWEPAVTRNILAKYRQWTDWDMVENYYAMTLGLA